MPDLQGRCSTPRCIPLSEVTDARYGGKALGLAELNRIGLRVPPTIVLADAHIADAENGGLPDELAKWYAALTDAAAPAAVAVRSSALGEDGADASFAGQYDTVLDVRGLADLRSAVDVCVTSLRSARASAYRGGPASTMNVVVQQMVAARTAGVIFTADPVTARRDLTVIDAVAGLGESLVDGSAASDHVVLDVDGAVIAYEVAGEAALLTPEQARQIHQQARAAAHHWGMPLDLEWAIDDHGTLCWLQARPITTLPGDLGELDTPLPRPDDIFTRCNIGEMMPGAVCPLTASVTGYAIEYGMQHVQVAGRAQQAYEDRWLQSGVFNGHMFLNMTSGTELSILGGSPDQYAVSACGRVVPELRPPPPQPLHRKLGNTVGTVRFTLAVGAARRELAEMAANVTVAQHNSVAEQLAALEAATEVYARAMVHHVRSSGQSAMAAYLLENLVARHVRRRGSDDPGAIAAELLSGAGQVEGAALIGELNEVVRVVAEHPDMRARFAEADADAALDWLTSPAAGAAAQRYRAFLARHGHRGYRELCMRDPAWADDPTMLINVIKANLAVLDRTRNSPPRSSPDHRHLPRSVRMVGAWARRAAVGREASKSQLVKTAYVLKCGFRHLGSLLERDGVLDDADLVTFLTRDELRQVLSLDREELNTRARRRRTALPFQDRLSFPDVCVGRPRPEHLGGDAVSGDDEVIAGRATGAGVVEAPVRVARTIAEAAHLQAGEILVAPVTDIGWTPYFSLISGLVTDIGSAVSHGAVVAREYGLPCVVNTARATALLRTGDVVRIDGSKGTVTVCTRAPRSDSGD